MRVSRQVVLGVALWTLVVAIGSTLVWTVITGVGDDLAASEQPVIGTPVATDPAGTPSASPTSTSTSPGPSRRPSASPSSGSASEPATAEPTPTDTGTSAPPAPSTPSTPSAPTAQRRAWGGAGGLVVAECTGSAIGLVAAQPNAGFAVEVDERGPAELEVKFEGREDESGRETKVRAECAAGVPRFEVETEDD